MPPVLLSKCMELQSQEDTLGVAIPCAIVHSDTYAHDRAQSWVLLG
jgi:hypothetical protein